MKCTILVIYHGELFGRRLYELFPILFTTSELSHIKTSVWTCLITVQKFQVIYCPKEVQLICLSATVANPDELAGWIGKVIANLRSIKSFSRVTNWCSIILHSSSPLLELFDDWWFFTVQGLTGASNLQKGAIRGQCANWWYPDFRPLSVEI